MFHSADATGASRRALRYSAGQHPYRALKALVKWLGSIPTRQATSSTARLGSPRSNRAPCSKRMALSVARGDRPVWRKNSRDRWRGVIPKARASPGRSRGSRMRDAMRLRLSRTRQSTGPDWVQSCISSRLRRRHRDLPQGQPSPSLSTVSACLGFSDLLIGPPPWGMSIPVSGDFPIINLSDSLTARFCLSAA
jgi:hypothetical protein